MAPALRASAAPRLRRSAFFSNLTAGGSAGVAKSRVWVFLKPLGRTLRAARLRRLLFAPAGLEFFAVAGMDLARAFGAAFVF